MLTLISIGCTNTEIESEVVELNRDKDKEFDEGSTIKFASVSDKENTDLVKLSKVWGLVKYYHPKAISGEVNMDYELFRLMPAVLEADSNIDLILYDWLKNLGIPEITSDSELSKDKDLIQLNPTSQWAEDETYLSKELSFELNNLLKTNISARDNAYVNFKDGNIYANMDNEKVYSSMDPKDTGYRLLGLFRYWNTIEYYYPYKNIVEEDWDKVLETFIPKFIEKDDHQSYALAIGELSTKIHDTHASVYDGNGKNISSYLGSNWLPASFIHLEQQIVINKTTEAESLKQGDIILSIDGETIEDIIEWRRKYQSQSRNDIVISSYLDIFRTDEKDVDVSLIRNGKKIQVNFKTVSQEVTGDIERKTQKIEDENIYYINAGQLHYGDINKIIKKAKDTVGLIIDMRNYPGVFIPYDLAEYLIPKEKEFVKVSVPNTSLPGEFYFLDTLVSGKNEQTDKSNENGIYQGKVLILMDEHTLSQGEFTVMSLRNTPGSIVLGRDSAGTDGNVLSFMLPGNVATTITGVGIFYPDESQTQRVGIKPDIYLNPTIKGIKEGKDEYLEKAIEIIKENQ